MKPEDRTGPLCGLRVIDLTEVMAGPLCTMVLSDMGAEVIKIERPGRGDASRGMGGGEERNPYFRYLNRNKKSVTLNIKHEEGRALFLELVRSADVVIENFKPTVMPRLGLGYDALKEIKPDLIYAQLSRMGYDGPMAERGGYDLIAQGMAGLMHVTGDPDGPPMSVGQPICDYGTGQWAVQGILAAVIDRLRTGRGALIECSLLETGVAMSSWTGAGYLATQQEPQREGSRHRQTAPYGRMMARDGYIVIGAGMQAIWERFALALGRPEWLEDPRFASPQIRVQNRPALEAEIEAVFGTDTVAHWVEVLNAAGIPAGPVNSYGQMFDDPQIRHRRMVGVMEDPELGEVQHLRTPIRMGDRIRARCVAPKLGEHTAEVLGEIGVDGDRLSSLSERKVV